MRRFLSRSTPEAARSFLSLHPPVIARAILLTVTPVAAHAAPIFLVPEEVGAINPMVLAAIGTFPILSILLTAFGIHRLNQARKARHSLLSIPPLIPRCAHESLALATDDRIVRADPAFTALTGWRNGTPFSGVNVPARLRAAITRHPSPDRLFFNASSFLRGNRRWTTLSISEHPPAEPCPTTPHQANRNIPAYTDHEQDSLTGLASRDGLITRITLLQSSPTPPRLALLYIDLNRFKSILDIIGHRHGDDVLRCVALRLRAAVPDAILITRLSGDEFAVLHTVGTDKSQLLSLAASIETALQQPLAIAKHQFNLSAGIGVAIIPDDTLDPEEACRYASLAVHHAKKIGSFRRFEPFMASAVETRATLETDLHHALALDQFFLEYQPQISLRTGALKGFEALIRWRHPKRGIISPLQFIPIAEKSGLIAAIGQWALRQACREALTWPPHIRLAVNLSVAQFQNGALNSIVTAVLTETGFPPTRLDLELTESIFLHDAEHAISILNLLREQGISIAMDDFGTGFSSLNYLRRFPFSKVKIDRSFIRDMTRDPQARSIVDLIAALGQTLHIDVVAEGVETYAQLNILRQTTCTEVQGYLIGRPGTPQSTFDRAHTTPEGTTLPELTLP